MVEKTRSDKHSARSEFFADLPETPKGGERGFDSHRRQIEAKRFDDPFCSANGQTVRKKTDPETFAGGTQLRLPTPFSSITAPP